jgi:hypothetical protein
MSYEGWLVTTATINGCEWEEPAAQSPSSLFVGHFTVGFSYAVDNKLYSGTFHSSHGWGKETEVPILYDPQNPMESCVCDDDESRVVPVLLEVLGFFIDGG